MADQIHCALNVVEILTTHPNYFSQLTSPNGWIEQTNVNVWVRIVQHLFSRLNHKSLFVRETLKSLIERIGLFFPHAISFPALIRSHEDTEGGLNNQVRPDPLQNFNSALGRKLTRYHFDRLCSYSCHAVGPKSIPYPSNLSAVILTYEIHFGLFPHQLNQKSPKIRRILEI